MTGVHNVTIALVVTLLTVVKVVTVLKILGILPIMPLVPVIPVLSLAVPGLSLAILGLSLLILSQFQDVPDSSCLAFYQQYINSYKKINLRRTMIWYIFQKNVWSKRTSCLYVNNIRKVIYKKKNYTEVKKCMLIYFRQIKRVNKIVALNKITIQNSDSRALRPHRNSSWRISSWEKIWIIFIIQQKVLKI